MELFQGHDGHGDDEIFFEKQFEKHFLKNFNQRLQFTHVHIIITCTCCTKSLKESETIDAGCERNNNEILLQTLSFSLCLLNAIRAAAAGVLESSATPTYMLPSHARMYLPSYVQFKMHYILRN
jgi:hypothetical protein